MSGLVRSCAGIGLTILASLVSSCGMIDLKEDLENVRQEYGYLKGRAVGPDEETTILIGLFKNGQDGASIVNVRSVESGEPFYLLVSKANYTLIAFADTNEDFVYQSGEPAARIDGPMVNWFSAMDDRGPVNTASLTVQQIDLSGTTVLDRSLDLSLADLRQSTDSARGFLSIVSWDNEVFSDANRELGIWEPGAFQEKIGYGLYLLEEFDPARRSIVLVHGINDTPRIFEGFANAIPDDYQLLLFHYPSAFPLEYTSYILTEALDELTRRYEIEQLDVVAHSMGGLVSKGLIYQADDSLQNNLRLFISIASPFGGHSAAAAGLKWSPVISPVWRAMAPGSSYLQKIDTVDLTQGPNHHLVYSYSHEAGGERKEDDGVVTVESQLVESAQRNATAVYGIADNHVGVVTNACTVALVEAILKDGAARVTVPGC